MLKRGIKRGATRRPVIRGGGGGKKKKKKKKKSRGKKNGKLSGAHRAKSIYRGGTLRKG